MTGFWMSGQHRAEVWGRPRCAGSNEKRVAADADDTDGTIWRVAANQRTPDKPKEWEQHPVSPDQFRRHALRWMEDLETLAVYSIVTM